MKILPYTRASSFLEIGLLTLILALFVSNAQAQVDRDLDGFDDALETTTGLPLAVGSIPACPSGATQRDFCVDLGPDLFVILTPVSPSSRLALLPIDPLGFIPSLRADLGVHNLTPQQAAPDKTVSPTTSQQKAIRILESLAVQTQTSAGSNTDAIWGKATSPGTPNTAGDIILYTQQIINDIAAKYQAAGIPIDNNKVNQCITHVIAHETGHNLGPLAPIYNQKLGGYHYSTTQQIVMSQAPVLSQKGSNVTIVCPNTWSSSDPTSLRLK